MPPANDFEHFDPYHDWLGIAPKDQPPNHYRLLGVDLFEANPTPSERRQSADGPSADLPGGQARSTLPKNPQ